MSYNKYRKPVLIGIICGLTAVTAVGWMVYKLQAAGAESYQIKIILLGLIAIFGILGVIYSFLREDKDLERPKDTGERRGTRKP